MTRKSRKINESISENKRKTKREKSLIVVGVGTRRDMIIVYVGCSLKGFESFSVDVEEVRWKGN
jgi:hypothetical protein